MRTRNKDVSTFTNGHSARTEGHSLVGWMIAVDARVLTCLTYATDSQGIRAIFNRGYT